MAIYNLNNVIPFEATHVGEILKMELRERRISQRDFARKTNIPECVISEIISGKRGINADYALAFERVLDIPAQSFMEIQSLYELDLSRIKERDAARQEELNESNNKESALNDIFNLKELYRRLEIKASMSILRLQDLSEKLGAGHEDMITRMSVVGCFKHSEKLRMDERNMRTWVIIAQYVAGQKKPDKAYTPDGASMAAAEIAAKANSENITESDIERILSANGIAYVVEPKLPGCPIDAYSVKINGVPSIITTHRHNNMEKLIFDVLHELGHIDMHIREDYSGYINIEGYESSKQEKEANEFARNALIAPDVWNDMLRTTVNTVNPQAICNKIAKRAKERGINPRIAVARYRHDSGEYRSKTYAPTRIV